MYLCNDFPIYTYSLVNIDLDLHSFSGMLVKLLSGAYEIVELELGVIFVSVQIL